MDWFFNRESGIPATHPFHVHLATSELSRIMLAILKISEFEWMTVKKPELWMLEVKGSDRTCQRIAWFDG